MSNAESLKLATRARSDKSLNKWRKDSVTGEVYTVLQRLERGAYAYRTRHIQDGKRDTYGLILASEIGPTGVEYMTPVTCATKFAYDYTTELPVIVFDENRGSISY